MDANNRKATDDRMTFCDRCGFRFHIRETSYCDICGDNVCYECATDWCDVECVIESVDEASKS